MAAILRIIGIVWVIGFIMLAMTATSQLLFARSSSSLARWADQLVAAVLWPIAVFSQAGRDSLRTRFRL